MTSGRLEAFSDGVLAIIITIMVLELDFPKEYTMEGLFEILPIFLSYFISFLYVAVYWVRHHQIFKMAEKVNPQILWANLNWLFWLSLIPFTTGWIGEGTHHSDAIPIATYGFILLMSQLSSILLRRSVVKLNGTDSEVGLRFSKSKMDVLFIGVYVVGIYLSSIHSFLAIGAFMVVWGLKVVEINKISRGYVE